MYVPSSSFCGQDQSKASLSPILALWGGFAKLLATVRTSSISLVRSRRDSGGGDKCELQEELHT